jgi:4-nitrophenyl phosphatase
MPPLSALSAFLTDGDGVLYKGSEPLPGAREFTAALDKASIPFLVLTNNATSTPEQVAGKLAKMQIGIAPERIFNSAQAAASWLKERFPSGTRALAVGESGLRIPLEAAGFTLVDDHRSAELVVAGLDRQATYAKLAEATLAINAGCPFVGTNPDLSIPTERGVEPGAGSVLAFLQAATGVTPTVLGKPQPGFFHQALARLGVSAGETAMIGDRYETDILGGANAGLYTIAVLTGISTAEEFSRATPPPTWIFRDLHAVLEAWQAGH